MHRTAVVALLGVLLAGCSDSPEVREPDPTRSPTAGPAPTMPAQAMEDTDEGRVAFVFHWIDVFNHASATGNTDELAELSMDGCEACANYVELFEETYAAGGYFRGGAWQVVDSAIEPDQAGQVFIRFTAKPANYKPTGDAAEQTGEPEDTSLIFDVVGAGEQRQVSGIQRIES